MLLAYNHAWPIGVGTCSVEAELACKFLAFHTAAAFATST